MREVLAVKSTMETDNVRTLRDLMSLWTTLLSIVVEMLSPPVRTLGPKDSNQSTPLQVRVPSDTKALNIWRHISCLQSRLPKDEARRFTIDRRRLNAIGESELKVTEATSKYSF